MNEIRRYGKSAVVVAAATVLARCLLPHLALANVIMIYLIGVVLVSMRYGRGPSIFCSIASVALFDFFCVPPVFTFAVSDSQYFLTFAVMLTVALVISTLTVRMRQQTDESILRERHTSALYRMSCDLSSSPDLLELYKIGLKHISAVFDAAAAIIIPNEEEKPSSIILAPDKYSLTNLDPDKTKWVMESKQVVGYGTSVFPGSPTLYLPLIGTNRSLAVLAIKPFEQNRFISPQQFQLLHTFANQLSQSCERAILAEENEKNKLQMKSEQLRNSLLSCISHDLRTPLATITGAASYIVNAGTSLDLESCREMAGEIFAESARLNRLVSNLLDMTRLQSGTLQLKKEWHPVDELVGAALTYMDDKMGGRTIKTNIPPDLPFLAVDGTLIQQVLVNLLENANKYTPPASTIELSARRGDNCVEIDVADSGPGIPEDRRAQVFEKFYRLGTNHMPGAGLGLAICRGIMEAHGGSISVSENPGGGALFRITIPAGADGPNLPSELEEGVQP